MSEPYKFTPEGTIISGIAEAKDPQRIGVGGSLPSEHTLNGHPQFGASASWDDVYMPQPKTRELVGTAAGSEGPCAGTNTLQDCYRYWPAHRGLIGDLTGPSMIKREISTLGCNRYTGVGGNHSDEGYWDPTDGTTASYYYRGVYLASPAFKGTYYNSGTANQNKITLDGSSDSNYIDSFVSAFAPGWFSNCCTKVVVDANDDEGPTEWGTFANVGNIRYGAHYYDDYDGGDGCGGDGGGDCCTVANTCGRLLIPETIASDLYDEQSPYFEVGGLLSTSTAHVNAGKRWLSISSPNHWIESDLYEATEPSQVNSNPPGRHGIVDNERTARHHNDIYCATGVANAIVSYDADGGQDSTEKCTSLCNGYSFWFVNQGRTYPSSSL